MAKPALFVWHMWDEGGCPHSISPPGYGGVLVILIPLVVTDNYGKTQLSVENLKLINISDQHLDALSFMVTLLSLITPNTPAFCVGEDIRRRSV